MRPVQHIGEIVIEIPGHKTLESMQEAEKRFWDARNFKADKLKAITPEGEAHLQRLAEKRDKAQPKKVLPTYAQEVDYNEAKAEIVKMVLRREYEIWAILNKPNDFKIVFSDAQKEVIEQLIKWLINDPTCKLILSKNIWLV